MGFLLGDFEKFNSPTIPFIVFKRSVVSPFVPQVPTFSYFTEFIESNFPPFKIPLEVTKTLVVTYAMKPDPIAAFSKVAGCDEEKVRANIYGTRENPRLFARALVPDITDADCSDDFTDTIQKFRSTAPQGTQCTQQYIDQVNQQRTPLQADTLRAVYYFCFDASPLFSGNGFGFSGQVNPSNEVPFAAATFSQSVQSREFVVPSFTPTQQDFNEGNVRILQFPTIPNAISTEKDGKFNAAFYSFLERGFFPLDPPQP